MARSAICKVEFVYCLSSLSIFKQRVDYWLGADFASVVSSGQTRATRRFAECTTKSFEPSDHLPEENVGCVFDKNAKTL